MKKISVCSLALDYDIRIPPLCEDFLNIPCRFSKDFVNEFFSIRKSFPVSPFSLQFHLTFRRFGRYTEAKHK